MKVQCVKLLNSDGKIVPFSPWLTLGKIYHVMSISFLHQGGVLYRIISNNKDPGYAAMVMISAQCFEVVSTIVPDNWRVSIYRDSSVDIAPASWLEDGFLEAFYDGDPAAYPVFERERDLIIAQDP